MASDIQTDTGYAQGLFRSLEAMEGVAPVAAPPRTGLRAVLVRIYPGVLVALTIALAATWLSQHYGAPVMLFARAVKDAGPIYASEQAARAAGFTRVPVPPTYTFVMASAGELSAAAANSGNP